MGIEAVSWNDTALTAMLLGEHGPVAIDLARRAVRVESAAKSQCTSMHAVDTGRLRGSITWWLDTDSDGVAAVVGTNVEYALFVHEGTRYMEGRPYLRNALPAAS